MDDAVFQEENSEIIQMKMFPVSLGNGGIQSDLMKGDEFLLMKQSWQKCSDRWAGDGEEQLVTCLLDLPGLLMAT